MGPEPAQDAEPVVIALPDDVVEDFALVDDFCFMCQYHPDYRMSAALLSRFFQGTQLAEAMAQESVE